MNICKLESCTGCAACENKCPEKCIDMKYNENGFLIPYINEEKCIKCKQCIKVCPGNIERDIENSVDISNIAYKCWSKDLKIRFQSSSGGIFSEVAKYVLNKNGIVYGATFHKNFNLYHKGIKNDQELFQLRKSKYIQSDTSGVYKSIKNQLENSNYVLFCGTPCQVDALKIYLERDYERLFTVDLLCHGVGSTKVFNDCINYLSYKYKSKPESIDFRYKRRGYRTSDFKIEFKNGKIYSKLLFGSLYGYPFAKKIIVRESCLNCKYSTINRNSDLTLGDYQNSDVLSISKYNKDQGVSILLVNSKNGARIFDNIKNRVFYENVSIEDTIRSCPTLKYKNEYNKKKYNEFFYRYNKVSFKEIIKTEFRLPFFTRVQHVIGIENWIKLVSLIKKILRR